MDHVVQQEGAPPVDAAPAGGLSLRWQLATLTLGLFVPTLLFVGILLWQIAASERSRVEVEARSLSTGVAVALDREINGVLSTLQALSTSPSLQTRDLPSFYAQVSEIHRIHGIHFSLRDRSGQTLLTTRAPLGTSVAVPALLAEADREIFETGKAVISNVFVSTTTRRPAFQVVAAPVPVAGVPTYLVAASIDLDYLLDTIRRENLPEDWIGALTDRNKIVAVRTVRHEDYVGKAAAVDFLTLAVGDSGSYYGRGSDGSDLLVGYARSELTGWFATAATPSSVVTAPFRRSFVLLVALGLTLGAIAAGTAFFVGRRLDTAMRRLAAAARQIGRGEQIKPVATKIAEVNQVGLALATAARRLTDRGLERDAAEAALRESNDQLQRYTYIVSHDLRAPLVNIMGFASELEATRADLKTALAGRPDGETFDRDLGEALGFIRTAVTKMEGLIAAILKMSREGRRTLRPERIVMTPFVQGLADAIRHQTDSVGATIDVSPDLPAIFADRLAVEQVFGNLLDNAVKYLAHERPGRVSVTAEERTAEIEFKVTDNGRGIAAQDQERVFELFRRAGVQDRPGEGIGLAHVRTVVRALGGRIDLASEFGRGTTFSVTLPRVPVASTLAGSSAATD